MTNIPYAGFWVRFFAACIDLAFYTPFYFLTYAIVRMFQAMGMSSLEIAKEAMGEVPASMNWTAEIIFVALGLLSYAWFFASKWRGSPGMKLLGIHIETAAGGRVSFLRALIWGITGTIGWLIAGAGVLYLQIHYNVEAINACLLSGQAFLTPEGNLDCGNGVNTAELLGEGGFARFMQLSTIASLLCFLLLFIWALSIGLARDKAGFHNRICGTRMVKSL